MRVRHFIVSACVGLSALVIPAPVYAWGAEGHRLTGLVAYELLTPQARAAVRYFLNTDSLDDAATWMDMNRPTLGNTLPGSAAWHFDDVEVCGHSTATEVCPRGNCASDKIAEYERVLSDSDATKDERTLALRLVVHMVGDIHQPLHAANNKDRGGNQISVLIGTRTTNLHSAWDTAFVRAGLRGSSEKDYADNLRTNHKASMKNWQSGAAPDWINESHQIALTSVYAPLPGGFSCPKTTAGIRVTLDDQYQAEAAKIIPQQLAKAGARIAFVLNNAFAGFTVP